MANIAANPWSLTSSDPATATITASTGLTLNADGTVTLTTTAALTFNTSGVPTANWFTVTGATAPAYNGFYKLLSGASGATSFTLVPQFVIAAGTAASGGGTVAQCLYPWEIRVEDISWQNASAAGQQIDLRDRNGNPVWQATATAAGSQNRGKVFWISGLTPITIQSGVVLLTVD
jgi:hypothetical protein